MVYTGFMTNTKPKECSVDGCATAPKALGLCGMHYQRFRKTGKTGPSGAVWGTVNRGKICRGPRCDRQAHVKGLCEPHYRQLQSKGELKPLSVRTHGMTIDEKIAHYTKGQTEGGCIEWGGPLDNGGYPALANLYIHRHVYQRESGEQLSGGTPVHHTCSNRLCINPEHLQAVTPQENTAEMLERRYYKSRIAALEAAIRAIDPGHEILKEGK